MLKYYQVFAKQIKRLPRKAQLSDFLVHQKNKQMVNYLLQWVQCWQHVLFTVILNKWQTKKLKEVYYQLDKFSCVNLVFTKRIRKQLA